VSENEKQRRASRNPGPAGAGARWRFAPDGRGRPPEERYPRGNESDRGRMAGLAVEEA